MVLSIFYWHSEFAWFVTIQLIIKLVVSPGTRGYSKISGYFSLFAGIVQPWKEARAILHIPINLQLS